MMRRTASKEPPEKGGWNVYFTLLDGLFNANPATNTAIRGDGKSGRQVGRTVRNWRPCVTNGSMRLTRMAEADRCADAVTDVAGRTIYPHGPLGPIHRASTRYR